LSSAPSSQWRVTLSPGPNLSFLSVSREGKLTLGLVHEAGSPPCSSAVVDPRGPLGLRRGVPGGGWGRLLRWSGELVDPLQETWGVEELFLRLERELEVLGTKGSQFPLALVPASTAKLVGLSVEGAPPLRATGSSLSSWRMILAFMAMPGPKRKLSVRGKHQVAWVATCSMASAACRQA
jgi:hypothetical protein